MMATIDQGRIWEEAASQPNNILVGRFSSDWRKDKASPPDPASYLPDDPVRRPAALLALLRADLTLRREAGEGAHVEGYLRRFPELPPDVLVALVYEEYCVRQEAGEAPNPCEYDTRFPAIAAEVRELIDIHEFVDSGRDLLEGEGSRDENAPFPGVGETIGGFRLVKELGRGGIARVFLALERHLANRPVALKVTRAGSHEPRTLALLQHTHIVPVFSYHVDAVTGLHLLCMPYFGRVTLADILAAPRTISARTGTDLLAALDELGAPERASPRAEGARRWAAARLPRQLPGGEHDSPRRCNTPTIAECCITTSNPPTCSSPPARRRCCSTSTWHGPTVRKARARPASAERWPTWRPSISKR